MTTPSPVGPTTSEREIANLIVAYAYLNDDADFAGLGNLFANAVFTLDGAVANGKAEIEGFARQIIELRPDGLSATSHEITNIAIHVDELSETATAQSYWTLYRSVSGAPRAAFLAGRYSDKFTRSEGTWQFSHRDAVSRWSA